METIHLSDKGTDLNFRFDAVSIRQKIVNFLLSNKKVVLDFSGVETVSRSFADECYAKLSFDFSSNVISKLVELKHANSFIFDVLESAYHERVEYLEFA